MSNEVKKEVNASKEKEKNKKRNILIIVGVILLLIILFLLWFFNRRFSVTFDLSNGTKDIVVKVEDNKVINTKDIKTKAELGDYFIDWYEVIGTKNNEDVLADKAYNFKTKIKKNTKIKAVYSGEVETITITFNSNGGSSVESMIINKGTELSLPEAPTYEEHKFIGWELKDETLISNNTKFEEDTTLFAKWEEEKKTETKKTESKKEEPKREKLRKKNQRRKKRLV